MWIRKFDSREIVSDRLLSFCTLVLYLFANTPREKNDQMDLNF